MQNDFVDSLDGLKIESLDAGWQKYAGFLLHKYRLPESVCQPPDLVNRAFVKCCKRNKPPKEHTLPCLRNLVKQAMKHECQDAAKKYSKNKEKDEIPEGTPSSTPNPEQDARVEEMIAKCERAAIGSSNDVARAFFESARALAEQTDELLDKPSEITDTIFGDIPDAEYRRKRVREFENTRPRLAKMLFGNSYHRKLSKKRIDSKCNKA